LPNYQKGDFRICVNEGEKRMKTISMANEGDDYKIALHFIIASSLAPQESATLSTTNERIKDQDKTT
jgi:hypothetical protein